jgi:hypothetical protein
MIHGTAFIIHDHTRHEPPYDKHEEMILGADHTPGIRIDTPEDIGKKSFKIIFTTDLLQGPVRHARAPIVVDSQEGSIEYPAFISLQGPAYGIEHDSRRVGLKDELSVSHIIAVLIDGQAGRGMVDGFGKEPDEPADNATSRKFQAVTAFDGVADILVPYLPH